MSPLSARTDPGVDLAERDDSRRRAGQELDDEIMREESPDVDPSVLIAPDPEVEHRTSHHGIRSGEAKLFGEAVYGAESRANDLAAGEGSGIDPHVGFQNVLHIVGSADAASAWFCRSADGRGRRPVWGERVNGFGKRGCVSGRAGADHRRSRTRLRRARRETAAIGGLSPRRVARPICVRSERGSRRQWRCGWRSLDVLAARAAPPGRASGSSRHGENTSATLAVHFRFSRSGWVAAESRAAPNELPDER